MAEPEKPLNVQVAEALGWHACADYGGIWHGLPEGVRAGSSLKPIRAYNSSWCVTGPLIERFKLALVPWNELAWEVNRYSPENAPAPSRSGVGNTALDAVCSWIVRNIKGGILVLE